MSAVVERMAAPTRSLELVTGNEIALEATRHLFLAVDLLDPARRKDINLPGGGEEMSNRCMWRTSGILPRCEITPMEMWGEPMPQELFPEGVKPLKLKGEAVEDMGIARQFVLQGKPLYFMPLFPGELIVDALGIASGERRGIVEIQALRNTDFGTIDREMQALFFPADYVKPVELRLVRERIERTGEAHADPDVKSVADDMLLSCDQAREYMQAILDLADTQLKTRVSFQHTHRLTPKIRSFMAQLEVKSLTENPSPFGDDVLKAIAGGGITAEVLESILSRQNAQFSQALREALAVQRAETAPEAPTSE